MEKLEKITMKTMEFDGPSTRNERSNSSLKEAPLLTEGSSYENEGSSEKKKGFDFISIIKNFFKFKNADNDFDEDPTEDEISSSLSETEEEGMTGERKASFGKMPVSFPWKSLNVKNALVVMSLGLIAVAGYINVKYYSENGAIPSGNDIYSAYP